MDIPAEVLWIIVAVIVIAVMLSMGKLLFGGSFDLLGGVLGYLRSIFGGV